MNSMEKVVADIAQWKAEEIEKADLMTRIGEDEIGWPYAWGATGQRCTVPNRQSRMNNKKIDPRDKEMIQKRCQVLNGSRTSCTGCKYYPDDKVTQMFDCIAFINQLLDYAGIPHYGAGCSIMWNHKANWEAKGRLSDMPETPCLVFQWYPRNEEKMQHIGFYIGDGWVIHCSVEVKKEKLSAYPWSHWGLPKGMGGDVPVTHKTIRRGSKGPDVVECQIDLIKLGYDLSPYGADGNFGRKTEEAVKSFQSTHNDQNGNPLKVDGIVGSGTWWALDEAVKPRPEPTEPKYTVIIPHLTEQQANDLQTTYPDAEKRKEG